MAASAQPAFAARAQASVAFLLLASCGLTAWGLHVMSHDPRVLAWVDRQEETFCRATRTALNHDGFLVDANDGLINDDFPSADYSKGGVYFIGSSPVRVATATWKLPAEERKLVHNYAINESDHVCEFMLVRYLVEHNGLLRAGGDKTLMVFGVGSRETGRHYRPEGYFVNLWQRHGLFTCSREAGIQPVPVNPVWRWIHLERVRIAGCLGSVAHMLQLRVYLRLHPNPVRNLDSNRFEQSVRLNMGNDWEHTMDDEFAEFNRMVEYLKARGVQMVVVLLPQGSWSDRMPFEREYRSRMMALCQAEGVPIRDWAGMLSDNEFADSGHCNIFGIDKMQAAFLDIALPFLHSTGALPDPARQPATGQRAPL